VSTAHLPFRRIMRGRGNSLGITGGRPARTL
jgi:hypothetical protein